jgi:hypothetical protein
MNDLIDSLIHSMLPNGAGPLSAQRLRTALDQVAHGAYQQGRSDALLSLRTAQDAADAWRVSPQRARAYIANRHERYGMGLRVGREWLLTQEEIDAYPPDAHRTRPAPPVVV